MMKMSASWRNKMTQGSVQYINPDDLPKNPAYTNVIVVSGNAKTIYIGAQLAFDASTMTIVGPGDVGVQTAQIMKNIDAALVASGAKPEHLIKVSVYIVQGQPLQPGFAAFQAWWGNRPNPPANTVMYIAGLVPPEFLVTIEAIAVIPEAG
jgi:enamine deaminase RidA (YjgF/YER057c/UK114 family)